MTNALIKTLTVTRLIVRKQRTRRVLLLSALVYLLLYLLAIGDLDLHGFYDEFAVHWSRQPLATLFKQRAPFYFEAMAVVNLPFMTYLFSPVNLLIAMLLSLLVGLNMAFSYIVIVQPKVCYGHPTLGVLSSLPALIAGSACCGPIILIVLGIQASAFLITFFGILIPIAIGLLLGALVLNGNRTNIDYLQEQP